jgi:hypothetical protein
VKRVRFSIRYSLSISLNSRAVLCQAKLRVQLIGSSFQLQASRALSSRFGATVGRRFLWTRQFNSTYPDSIFSGKPQFSDVNLGTVFIWTLKPLSNRNAMSHVLSLRARGSLDLLSSGIEQYIDPDASFPDPADILFEEASSCRHCFYY